MRKRKRSNERTRNIKGQAPNYTACHGERNKERYTETEKDKSPRAKSRQDNVS